MELILVRHAEPEAEAHEDGRAADPPLTERGRTQARAVAAWLTRSGVDAIVSSPARRALETATETAKAADLDVETDMRLRDANEGAPSYVPLEDARAADPAGYRARVDAYRTSPRLDSIRSRVLEALGERAARARGQRVAVFCHGSVINVFAADVLGIEQAAFLEAEYASAHRFLLGSSGIRNVKSLNETAYLLP